MVASLALLIFIIVALAVPSLLILISLLLRPRKAQNQVSGLNFESAEQSIGGPTGIMSEYFHYFTSFLALEVIAAVFIIWVYVSGSLSVTADYYVIGLVASSLVFELFMLIYARQRGVAYG